MSDPLRPTKLESPDIETDVDINTESDTDPEETREWEEALAAVLATGGPARVRFLLDRLNAVARQPAVGWAPEGGTPYVNTIPVERQPAFPGDLGVEERLASLMRWNALAMVVRANRGGPRFDGAMNTASGTLTEAVPRD